MLRSEYTTETAGNGERVAARVTTRFIVGYCAAMARVGGGDLLRGLLLTAILDANTAHIGLDHDGRDAGGLDSIPPDSARTPISISALARSLNIPYETTRRHVTLLIKEGVCVRVPDQGVIVPAAWVAAHKDLTVQIYEALQSLMGSLFAAGIDIEGMARAKPK